MDDIGLNVEKRIKLEKDLGDFKKNEDFDDSVFVRNCLKYGDDGNAALYAYLTQNRFRYNYDTACMVKWAKHFWELDTGGSYVHAVRDVADRYHQEGLKLWEEIKNCNDSDTKKRLERLQNDLFKTAMSLRYQKARNACLSFAKTIETPFCIKIGSESFDSKPMLLACKNGVIDLETGDFRDGRHDDYLIRHTGVGFLGYDHPITLWLKTLNEIFDGDQDTIDYIQRLFGYGITGYVDEHVFPVFQGRGRNGKGLILNVMKHVLSSLYVQLNSQMLLTQPMTRSSSAPSPDLMSLKGARIAVASEAEARSAFAANQVKLLTGGDPITARSPHDKNQSEFDPTHLLILLTNDKPKAPHHDFAFWSRVHLVEFPLSFVDDPKESFHRKKNPKLFKELIKEAPGILAWLIKGCLLFQKGGLKPTEKILRATIEYQKEEDMLLPFLEECCVVGPGLRVKAKDVFEAYKVWYEEFIGGGRKRTPSQKIFGRLMGEKFDKKKSGVNWYLGVDLKDDAKIKPESK
jgi:putative DNA primase/helicase